MSRLALQAVAKRFGALTAVAPLTVDFPAGCIHGLLGENGAGKSTLVRMIAGVTRPDTGSIRVDGSSLPRGDARAARAAGVGVVHQHFALIGALSVAENLLLGRTEVSHPIVRPAVLARAATELATAHGFDIGDPEAPCRTLPVGTLARIEILRALAGSPRVLLLDEPTAVLTPPEVTDLFATLRRLRDTGMLILFVTHKLEEALRLCDAVTVLRGGRVAAERAVSATSAATLAAIMVGADASVRHASEPSTAPSTRLLAAPEQAADSIAHSPPVAPPVPAALSPTRRDEREEPSVLMVRNLATSSAPGRTALGDIGFDLRIGEIRGVAGVDGNGQDELADALCGVAARTGSVEVGGVTIPPHDVRLAQAAGLALIPSDRQRDGLALDLSVWENILLAAPILKRFAPRGIIDEAKARAFTEEIVRDYRVTLWSIDQPARALSGGNQQRIVIGRTLATRPRVLIAVNPTRGLDIAATTHVHGTLRRVAAAGAAVLLVSTDLDELLALAPSIHVLFRGRLSTPVTHPQRATIGRLMAGLET